MAPALSLSGTVHLDIVIPTFRRVHRLHATYEQLAPLGHRLLFVCHYTDEESQQAVQEFGLSPVIDYQPPSGVNATNAGYWAATSDLVVIGQDDFTWHEGWLEAALKYDAPVVGFNDGFPGRTESQHSVGWLIRKPHYVLGFTDAVFFPFYKKNYADDELNTSAKVRDEWAYAADALVEHVHPGMGKAPLDETYTRLEHHLEEDRRLFLERLPLFGR